MEYQYKGRRLDNTAVQGSMTARDEEDLRQKLRAQQIFVLSCRERTAKESKFYTLRPAELSDFCRQLHLMLSAGISIVRALEIMRDRDLPPRLRDIYDRLCAIIQQGNSLADGMEQLTGSFPMLMINMFRAGEASGRMDKTALKMADYYEKEQKLKSKVTTAMVYPLILLVMTIGVVLVIFTVVLPEFFDLFEGLELPILTKVIIAISQAMTQYWYLLLVGALVIVALVLGIVRQPAVRLALHKMRVHLPIAGKMFKTIYTARFARTLSSLYSSGLPMVRAVSIAAAIVGNDYVTQQFDDAIRAIQNGEKLSVSLGAIDGFDKKLAHILIIGEESGKLEKMLESVADSFDYESEMATERLVTLIEPIMILLMAVVVGIVVLAVMQPIMTLYTSLG